MTPLENAKQRFAGKNILVVGLGLLGGAVGDVRFFSRLGSHVRITDKKPASYLQPSIDILKEYRPEYSLERENLDDIKWADVILRNPSVPATHPLIMAAQRNNKPTIMRSALFAELSKMPLIGVTGTRGKTTTTMMIYELVKHLSQKKVILGGNIAGISDLELLEQVNNPQDYLAVLELSSWQLQGFKSLGISPHISVITNLYPDHLNMYSSLEAYYQDKKTIIQFQTPDDVAILNADQPEFHVWSQETKANVQWFAEKELSDTLHLRIPGNHNRANAAAAWEVGRALGFSNESIESILSEFTGVPYRLQTVAVKNAITYINDTTATTPIAGMIALHACSQSPIVICGGADKNLSLEEYAEALNQTAKKLILLSGTGTDRLKNLLHHEKIAEEVDSMSQAVQKAHELAHPGDIVLLSPGFASFGLFNNEFDRGDQFNECVNALP